MREVLLFIFGAVQIVGLSCKSNMKGIFGKMRQLKERKLCGGRV